MIITFDSYYEYINADRVIPAGTFAMYDYAIKTIGIKDIDTDKIDQVWIILADKLNSGIAPSAVRTMITIIRASMSMHGLTFTKTRDYNMLLKNLRKHSQKVLAYTDDDIRKILRAAELYGSNQKDRLNTFKLCILLAYSGIRVESAFQLDIDQFQRENNGVYTFIVNSKGKRDKDGNRPQYTAAISEYAYGLLKTADVMNECGDLIEYKPKWNAPFPAIYRRKLATALIGQGALIDKMNQKSIFHSFRHWFANKLAESALHKEDVSLLLGHRPDSLAYKVYADSTLREKVAQLYAQTSLNQLRLYDSVQSPAMIQEIQTI